MSSPDLLIPAEPKSSYLAHKAEIDQAIHRVLASGWYILGQEVEAFEKEFARYVGVRYAIGVGSGTEAIHVALRACGIGLGDAVVTVSHTAVATVAAIELAGAAPVLVDIDAMTFSLDASRLEDVIKKHDTGRIKAIIPVHLYGHPADMPAILAIAERFGLMVIEDCAQSHGASIDAQKTGTWGHMAAFSFYPTKNLGALGDGGAVVTNDKQLADKARLIREYGWRERYTSDLPGMNTRLDEIQAAILRVKLPYLDKENDRRRQLARLYNTLLSPTPLILPREQRGLSHVYHQYVVRSSHRDELRTLLKANSVGTFVHYPVPVHLQPAYRGRVMIGKGGLQHTEEVCKEVLSLPMSPQMTDEHVQRVSELVGRWHSQVMDKS